MAEADPNNQSSDVRPDKGKADKPERKLSAEQIRVAAKTAAQGVRLGKSASEIVSRLRQAGLTYAEAAGIEDHVRVAYQHSQLRIGTMLMVSGAIWIIGAIAFATLRTDLQSATQAGYLLLIGGILQVLYGWQRRAKARTIRPMRDQDVDR